MALNWPRMRRQLLRGLAGRWLDLPDVASRTWVACPESVDTSRPAISPPGAIDRVKALSPYRQWPQEHALIAGGQVQLKPTMAYECRNAELVGGQLFVGSVQYTVGIQPSPYWLRDHGRRVHLPQAQLTSTLSGTTFFGCLLLDDFAIELLGEPGVPRLSARCKPSGHEAGYRELLGLGPKRMHERAGVDRLVVFDDPPYNPSRVARYRELVQRLRQSVGAPVTSTSGPRIYLRRGLAGQRRLLVNEPALEAALARQGFTIIDPMAMSAHEIARATVGARCVVSVEGSQISHAIFALGDEAAIVVLQPPDRFCLQYKEFADAMGHRFAFTVGETQDGGFAVDIDELLVLLEKLPGGAAAV